MSPHVPERRQPPPDAAAPLRWDGESAFQVLGYPFTLRWNWPEAAAYVDYVLGGFRRAAPPAGGGAGYDLVDHGPSDGWGRYSVFVDGERMLTSPRPGDAAAFLLWHVFHATIAHTRELLMVHAGSVVSPAGHAVVLPAEAGSGKTTLTVALVRAGFGFLSDEVAAIDPDTLLAHPYGRAINLKKSSWRLFPDLPPPPWDTDWAAEFRFLRPTALRADAEAAPAPVRLVVAPRYVPGARTEVTPMRRAEAVVELGQNLMNLQAYSAPVLPLLTEIVSRARCFRMVSGDLGDAVRAVSELAAAD